MIWALYMSMQLWYLLGSSWVYGLFGNKLYISMVDLQVKHVFWSAKLLTPITKKETKRVGSPYTSRIGKIPTVNIKSFLEFLLGNGCWDVDSKLIYGPGSLPTGFNQCSLVGWWLILAVKLRNHSFFEGIIWLEIWLGIANHQHFHVTKHQPTIP